MTRPTAGNGDSNTGQRKPKRLGGVTGKGFMPGQSGNPKGGRPKTKGLINALRAKVAQIEDGRTVEERLVEALIDEALEGGNRLPAIQAVFDRLEGKPKQQLDFNDVTKTLEGKSTEELLYYAKHGEFPNQKPEEPSAD